MGADLNNPSPLVSIRAPISGSIVEQNVTGGTGVRSLDNSPNLFTIADLSEVWVLCDVYENDLHRVRLGDPAEVRLNAFPDRVFTGRVGNISTVLDPSTRTAKVRLELANPGGLMRTGMFATATFRSRTEQMRPMVPTTAILRLHDKDWVFVPLGGNRFRRLEVRGRAGFFRRISGRPERPRRGRKGGRQCPAIRQRGGDGIRSLRGTINDRRSETLAFFKLCRVGGRSLVSCRHPSAIQQLRFTYDPLPR